MEVGVRIVGVVLRVLNFILAPLFWLRWRKQDHLRVPPIRNTVLLQSASELAAAIRSGKLTSEEVVRSFIARIKEVNPLINAVVQEIFCAAVARAIEVDLMLQEVRMKGSIDELMVTKPLLGVPFTVKESCSLRSMSNSVGCLEHQGRLAQEDGGAVRLVTAAGAIPLLVSNTPELCLGWETSNLLRGATCNPYRLSATPGGSSGGEAALLASGASALSVSSDIAGSIRIPAAFCGVFGHKPTPGIISIEGHVPTLTDENYPKFLTVGPMTRYAEDLPLMLSVMAAQEGYRLELHRPVAVDQLRIYHMTEATKSIALLSVHPAIKEAVLKATDYLHSKCGATLCDEKFTELEESVEMSVSVFFAMKDIPNMLQDPLDPKHEKNLLMEIMKYFNGNGSRSLQALGFALLSDKLLFIPQHRLAYYRERARRLKNIMMEKLGTDGVLLYPVHSSLAHYHHQVFLRASGVMYSMLFNVLGFPATVVPMGLHRGLPVAIQVIAAPYQDRLCLAVAKQLEERFGGWQPIV
ncbi:fatty-acid amide hydrolase 2-A-like [Pararge aegeria]|uniref:Jg1119 protein n=1 Tax=Pararge aegeria aegeria TaxID=348720 RepID=A0A8S4R5I6_9NEOP|nr:fatty-acid amide hydrolase 2-A-like [Pararge aegeria]XP_039749731.1 fatty-acid amide hydrolase 2-A-like [Pararge aegeria]XP_039749732.1 fatty-acid amide hydrolase 2-A-like [Pararge aegeria]CAH2232074.1 jg1119 [Pararge aegeria aegeria]